MQKTPLLVGRLRRPTSFLRTNSDGTSKNHFFLVKINPYNKIIIDAEIKNRIFIKMNRQIQTITEKNRFDGIINKYFQSNSLFYKSQSGNILVQYLGIINGMAEIKFPDSIGVPDECVFFTSQDEKVIISYMAKEDQKSEEIALYNPSSFQIVSSTRDENRRDVVKVKNALLYARNMISEHHIYDNIKKNHEKVEKIKKLIMQNEADSKNLFKIKILSEISNDTRRNFFKEFNRPLFVSSRFKDENDSRNIDIKYYLNHIYSNDNDLMNESSIISEISVPIIYQKKINIGYLQVNSSSVLTLSALHNYKRLAMIIENKIIENKIIEEEENGFLVSNISPGGLCIVYKDNGKRNIFMKKGLTYFDILLPYRQKVSLVSEVRHIVDMPNDVKKIGFKILEIDKQGEKFLTKYLKELTL